MKYLKVFTDFDKDTERLTDAEMGRLFRAMLLYAREGTESDLRGNEIYLWGMSKKNIDNQRESYKKQCEVNKTNRNGSSQIVTNGHESSQEKEKDKDKDKDKKKESIKKENIYPSSADEVEFYIKDSGLDKKHNFDAHIFAEEFFDYFSVGNWYDSNNKKVKNWKQKVQTWIKFGRGQKPTQPKRETSYDLSMIDELDLMTPV